MESGERPSWLGPNVGPDYEVHKISDEEASEGDSREFLSISSSPAMEDSNLEDVQMATSALMSLDDANSSLEVISPVDPPPPLPEVDYLARLQGKALEWVPLEDGLEVEIEDEFVWKITDWPTMASQDKALGPEFSLGGFNWRPMIFPKGSDNSTGKFISVFLSATPTDPLLVGDNWHVCARLILALQNPQDRSNVVAKPCHHRFDPNESDWGFASFLSNKHFTKGDPSNFAPLLQDDAVNVIAKVQIIKDPTENLWHNFINYNSKKSTGCVGLANQGATCYMNSLLQSLFMTNLLRKATFKIPTQNDQPTDSIPLALQRVFYRLQTSEVPVGTTELTKSFGWDSMDSFMQHDVHEFNRVLMDELENKMKKTEVEGMIEKIFTGKVKNVRKCLNVPFESVREEAFYDIQLTIKGLRNLEESFQQYVKPEMLTGDNKYRTEEFGLQDAKMYVVFEKFPPVLHLHLERYTFDPTTFNTIKINDYFEFPEKINLDKYLSDTADHSVPQNFVLHSVLVHGGDSHGGHYNAFIKKDGKWFKFDDTRVVQVSRKEATEDNYGYSEVDDLDMISPYPKLPSYNRIQRFKRMTNAYMLVYIREADWDYIMSPVMDADIPEYIASRVKADEEAELKRRLERQETMMAVHVSIFTDELLKSYSGPDFFNVQKRCLPLTQYESFRMRKDQTVGDLKQVICDDMNLREGSFRVWTFANRRNQTCRLDEPLSDDDRYLSALTGAGSLTNQIFLYLEITRMDESGEFIPFSEITPQSTFIYFKFFDRETSTLIPLMGITVQKDSLIEPYIRFVGHLSGLFSEDTAMEVFEEVKAARIERVLPTKTFTACSLGTGDILILQKAASGPSNVLNFFAEIVDRILVAFRPLEDALGSRKRSAEDLPVSRSQEEIEYTFSTSGRFNQLVEMAAQNFGTEPRFIRLHWFDPRTERYHAIKNLENSDTTVTKALEGCLSIAPPNWSHMSRLVFAVEALSVAVDELDSMKNVGLHFSGFNDVDVVERNEIYIPFHATFNDLLTTLPTSVASLVDPSKADSYRLLEVAGHKITRDYGKDDLLATIPDLADIYLQPIELGPNDKLVSVFYYWREPIRTHSVPFVCALKPEQTFGELKKRLLAKINDDSATLNLIIFGRPKLVDDSDVLYNALETLPGSNRIVYHEQLAIEVTDPIQQDSFLKTKSMGYERSIKIRSSTPSQKTTSSN